MPTGDFDPIRAYIAGWTWTDAQGWQPPRPMGPLFTDESLWSKYWASEGEPDEVVQDIRD